LEEYARKALRKGRAAEQIVRELEQFTGSETKALAILKEVTNTEHLPEGFINDLCKYSLTGYSAFTSGLGCRGEGDFIVHHTIAEIIGETGAVVDSRQQDDGGIISTEHGIISAAVDGMHSRLSQFPFLAGFHAARAAIRDVIVMGARPVAMLSDIHIANDGDVGKILDYTAGASSVSELLGVPLIGGSTLRLGGDLVTGDRLTGCIVGIGTGRKLTARRNARSGDVLVMTEGYGGGTITTTALYNGYPEILLETLNVKTILAAMKLLDTPLIEKIHAMTDITNGGIRGDAHEFGSTAKVKVIINKSIVGELISPAIIKMLKTLEIDPLGISIDALLFTLDSEDADELISFFNNENIKAKIVGNIEKGSGVYIKVDESQENIGEKVQKVKSGNDIGITEPKTLKQLETRFREVPYTPLKNVVDDNIPDIQQLTKALKDALRQERDKKNQIIEWIRKKEKK
jgi:hydrogenase expression/formation protein